MCDIKLNNIKYENINEITKKIKLKNTMLTNAIIKP